MTEMNLPVVVLGAGPVGLAAVAHLLERGIDTLLLEAATDVAASQRAWSHVRLFSPWRYNVDKAAARLLERSGWLAPEAEQLPTGGELYERYLKPLAAVPAIRSALHVDRRVTAITRRGLDKIRTRDRAQVPFVVRTRSASGVTQEFEAQAVIDATGTWWSPNPLGAAGIPALGEAEASERIHYGIPDVLGADSQRYAGKTTLVVGAGHSAANAILGLVELAAQHPSTQIHWATRSDNLTRVFGGGDADGLPARGKLGAELQALIDQGRLSLTRGFRIARIEQRGTHLEISGTKLGEPFSLTGIDSIITATGQRPDLQLTRELRVSLDPALESASALAPLIDPNEHSCGSVRPHGALELAHPEPNFYIVGSKSYGRAPTFLLATGYEQVRSVAAMISGDYAAATRVELDLPETGVCTSNLEDTAGGCCPPAAAPAKKGCC
jgi:thioredoxin reductase